MILESSSRPLTSRPKGCFQLGPSNACARSSRARAETRSAGYGARSGASAPTRTVPRTRPPPIRMSGRRSNRSIGRLRDFDSMGASAQLDPGIEKRVKQVHDEIDKHVAEGHHKNAALDQGI